MTENPQEMLTEETLTEEKLDELERQARVAGVLSIDLLGPVFAAARRSLTSQEGARGDGICPMCGAPCDYEFPSPTVPQAEQVGGYTVEDAIRDSKDGKPWTFPAPTVTTERKEDGERNSQCDMGTGDSAGNCSPGNISPLTTEIEGVVERLVTATSEWAYAFSDGDNREMSLTEIALVGGGDLAGDLQKMADDAKLLPALLQRLGRELAEWQSTAEESSSEHLKTAIVLERRIAAQAAEIERLKAKWQSAEEMLRESDSLAAKAQAEIEALKAALEWYANPVLYEPHTAGEPNGVSCDKGWRARAALNSAGKEDGDTGC